VGWEWDPDLKKCVKDGETRDLPGYEPTAPTGGIEIASDDAVTLDPYSISTFTFTISNTGKQPVQDVRVSLDAPSDWQVEGQQSLGTIDAGGSRFVRVRVATGKPGDESVTIRATSDQGDAQHDIVATVACPDFLIRPEPSLTQATPEVVYAIVCADRDDRTGLEIELDINRGSRTVFAEYLRSFDVTSGSAFIHAFPTPPQAAEGSVARGILYERGTLADTNQVPMIP
jgi:hypothetical protein